MLANWASGNLTHIYASVLILSPVIVTLLKVNIYILQKKRKLYEPKRVEPSFPLVTRWVYLFSLLCTSLFYQYTYLTFTVNYIAYRLVHTVRDKAWSKDTCKPVQSVLFPRCTYIFQASWTCICLLVVYSYIWWYTDMKINSSLSPKLWL